MQFFPFSSEASSPSALSGVSVAANKGFEQIAANGDEFLNQLNEQLAAQGITPVVSESGPPAGFRSVSLDKDSLKSEDLEVLRASLKKRGLKDEQLNSLENLINSGQPMTMGALVNALSGKKRNTPALTEEERQQLGSALRKMGFTQDETTELESMMDQGKSGAAMQAINRKLRAMEQDARLSLDKVEAQSLARGLELSDKASQKMMALFGQNEQLDMNKEGLSALLAQANKEVAEKSQAARKLAKELQGAIDDTLKSAKFREATASDADARASRKAERSETRINDKLTAKSNNLGPEALAERIRRLAQAGEEGDAAEQEQDLERHLKDMAHKAFVARKEGGGDSSASRGEESRVRRSESSATFANVVAEGMFSSTSASSSGAAARPEGLNASVRQELFSQVEQGMLRELSDGSHKITLQLAPENLGQVSVMLTVRQGEVRAVIRTDNEETSAALSQQMAQLKTSLEEQGLKVAQLEVETRMADNASDQNWGSAAQYNQEQELREQARFLQLSKLRREAGNDLARNMQNTSVKAALQEEISGLHIVA